MILWLLKPHHHYPARWSFGVSFTRGYASVRILGWETVDSM